MTDQPVRDFDELRTSGLLWAINRVLLHPRGFALSLSYNPQGELEGWVLKGDGTETWSFPEKIDTDRFKDFEKLLRPSNLDVADPALEADADG